GADHVVAGAELGVARLSYGTCGLLGDEAVAGLERHGVEAGRRGGAGAGLARARAGLAAAAGGAGVVEPGPAGADLVDPADAALVGRDAAGAAGGAGGGAGGV